MIAIPILSNISRRKVNQAVKLGQFVAYNVRNVFFFQTSCRKWRVILVSDPFLLFEKALYKVKQVANH